MKTNKDILLEKSHLYSHCLLTILFTRKCFICLLKKIAKRSRANLHCTFSHRLHICNRPIYQIMKEKKCIPSFIASKTEWKPVDEWIIANLRFWNIFSASLASKREE